MLALWLVLAGCGQRSAEESLRFGLASAPVTLDPRFATDATSVRINRLLYAQLVDFDEAFQPVPALSAWQVLTPTHYRFRLGDQYRDFHDGSRLTADDVKATYASVLDEATASPHRGSLTNIQRIDVMDADTVDFHLNNTDPLFPARLVIGIMPQKLLTNAHPFRQQPMGSGVFLFLDWPEEGRLRLQRHRDQYPVDFVKIKEPTVRVLKLLRGEVDIIQNDLQPELIDYLLANSDVAIERGNGTRFSYLGFNMQDPIVGNQSVRQAIAHAIDRQALIHYVFANSARPANALLPPEHWAGNPDIPDYDYDPAKAVRLLSEAGFHRQTPLRITYKTSSDPFRIRLATIIQQQLAEVGIDVELQTFDWGTFYGDIKAGRFQMFSLSWVGIKTPDIFRYVFHSSSTPPAGANRGRFADQEVDRLIEQAEAAPTLDEQAQLYRRLQQLLWEKLPYVPLWYEDNVVAVRGRVSGYRISADGNYDGLNEVEKNRAGVSDNANHH